MPKTPHKQPSNAHVVHYRDLAYTPSGMKPKVQIYCKQLLEREIRGQLWIYQDLDEDCEYLPDVIYPSIVSASNDASTSYKQIGIHYGVKTIDKKKTTWGLPGN